MPAPFPTTKSGSKRLLTAGLLLLSGAACSDSGAANDEHGAATMTGGSSATSGGTASGNTTATSGGSSTTAVTTSATTSSNTQVANVTNVTTTTANTGAEASSATGSGGGGTSGTTGGSPSSGGPRPGDGAVTVDGPQILVNGELLHLRGVNWNPVPVGGSHPQDLAYAEFAAEDIPLMQAAGINAVRTYEPLTAVGVLDALADAGIFVLNTVFPYGGNPASSVDAPVNAVKDHPAILLWVIGNEWNYNGLYVDLSIDASIDLINEVSGRIRDLDANHPIATVYGELPDASVLDRLSDIDVWGLNVYSGRSFGDRFTQWAERSEKPMFFGEYGADAWNASTGEYDPESQAIATLDLTREILDQSTYAGGVCSGGTIFEFSDEWWKDQGGSASAQDVGGIAPGGGPFPDSTFNEEYWGIVTIERVPRPAYDVLKELYSE